MASIKKRELPPKKGQETPRVTWRARYRDAAGKEHVRHFPRRLDAQRWLDETTTSIISGQYVDPNAGKITFKKFFQEWAARQLWTRSTRETADQAAASVPFADMQLAKIHRADIEAWIKAMTDGTGEQRALAPSTIATRYNFTAMAFRGAVRDRRLAVDPSVGIKLPRRRRAEQSMEIPTVQQVRAALEAAPAEYRALVAVCAFAGLRLGEMAGLQVGDVDFLRRTLRVGRQVQGDNVESTRLEPPKAGSERTIAIPKELADILARHISEIGTIRDEGFFFFRGGDLLNRNSAGHIWREIRKAANLPTTYTIHTLRHFYASALIASGCDVVTVQRALGHSSASITLGVYSHMWPSAEDRTRDAASTLMRSVLEPAADSVRTAGQV